MIDIIIKNAGVWCGILALFIAVRVDRSRGNSSALEIFGCLALIISASALSKRKAGPADFLIAALSGMAEIGLSFLLDNGSMLELCGGITAGKTRSVGVPLCG